MVGWLAAGFAVLVLVQRFSELKIAHKNRVSLTQLGAVEYGASHYPLFFLLHGTWFAGWLTEMGSNPSLHTFWYTWLFLFAAAQALRYWCIFTLKVFWNTRIVVLPGAVPISKGPYRYMRHPNYLAVAIELVALPMIFNCWITATAIAILNGILLLGIRIPAEEKALRQLKKTVS